MDDKRALGSNVLSVDTYGKNILISFSSNLYLCNHMMMWGKWRIYEKPEYDSVTYINLLWIHVWDPMTPIEDFLRVGDGHRMDEM